jgi:hypothetical protein
MLMIERVENYTDSESRCSIKAKTGGIFLILLANLGWIGFGTKCCQLVQYWPSIDATSTSWQHVVLNSPTVSIATKEI